MFRASWVWNQGVWWKEQRKWRGPGIAERRFTDGQALGEGRVGALARTVRADLHGPKRKDGVALRRPNVKILS
jgi:ribosomal protein L15E